MTSSYPTIRVRQR